MGVTAGCVWMDGRVGNKYYETKDNVDKASETLLLFSALVSSVSLLPKKHSASSWPPPGLLLASSQHHGDLFSPVAEIVSD
jgi:hypothetical protein